jgi:hypothetical protein
MQAADDSTSLTDPTKIAAQLDECAVSVLKAFEASVNADSAEEATGARELYDAALLHAASLGFSPWFSNRSGAIDVRWNRLRVDGSSR